MKSLVNFIQEGLKLGSSKIKSEEYTEHPKIKDELRDILIERLPDDPNADLNDIDVSAITDMSYLFAGLDPHNIKIDRWDVSNVINMTSMFNGRKNFNADISGWDVKNVTYMNYMFDGCKKFDQDLSSWQLPNITYNTRYLKAFANTPIENKPEKQPYTPNLR